MFSSATDQGHEIYVMYSNGTGLTRLTNDAAEDRNPAWSPDGTKIAFDSDRHAPGGFHSIYVMDANGANVERLIETDSTQPAWSPDGAR